MVVDVRYRVRPPAPRNTDAQVRTQVISGPPRPQPRPAPARNGQDVAVRS
jgi:hypothetical protein